MYQEIAAYGVLFITIFFIIKGLFFKKKKSGTKHCGVNDCDIH